VKLIFENWRRFKSKVNENNEKLQRLYDLIDEYPNIDYERLQDISGQVHDMMYPRDAIATPIGIEDLDLEFEGDEAGFAKRLYALNKELKRGSLKEARMDQVGSNDDPEYIKGIDEFIKKHKITPDRLKDLASEQNVEELERLAGDFIGMWFGIDYPHFNDLERFIASVSSKVNQGAQNTVNESAFLPRVPHAGLAHRLAGAVNKFGFRKLSNADYNDLGRHLESLTKANPDDARNSIIDFLVSKRLANRSLFYNIR
jgi:hypothetical protein